MEEAEHGREKNLLVPVFFETVRPPFGFRQIQAEDLSLWDGAHEFAPFQKLLRDIESVIGPRPSTIRAAPREEAAKSASQCPG